MEIKDIANKYYAQLNGEPGDLGQEAKVENAIIRPMVENIFGYSYELGGRIGYDQQVDVGQVGSKANHSHCDYLITNNDFKIVIEAKSVKESVTNPKHIAELKSYALLLRANLGILTNGRVWHVFMVGEDFTMDSTPFIEFDILKSTPEEQKNMTNLFKRGVTSYREVKAMYQRHIEKKSMEQELSNIKQFILNDRRNYVEMAKRFIKAYHPKERLTNDNVDKVASMLKAVTSTIDNDSPARLNNEAPAESKTVEVSEETNHGHLIIQVDKENSTSYFRFLDGEMEVKSIQANYRSALVCFIKKVGIENITFDANDKRQVSLYNHAVKELGLSIPMMEVAA